MLLNLCSWRGNYTKCTFSLNNCFKYIYRLICSVSEVKTYIWIIHFMHHYLLVLNPSKWLYFMCYLADNVQCCKTVFLLFQPIHLHYIKSVLSIFMHVLEIIFYSPVWVSQSIAKFKTAGKASRPRRRKMPSPASSYTTHRSMLTVPPANRKRLSLNGRASPAGPLLRSTRPGPNYTLYGNGPQTFQPMSSLANFSHAVTVTWDRLSSNFIRISILLMKRNC